MDVQFTKAPLVHNRVSMCVSRQRTIHDSPNQTRANPQSAPKNRMSS